MFDRSFTLDQADPDIWAAVQHENQRQEQHIELIASENYATPAVMQAQGTQLTNKYAEGYPGKRYYGDCDFVELGRAHVCIFVTTSQLIYRHLSEKKNITH